MLLGRCRRSVLVVDAGAPRNARSKALHGFLSRDGVAPLDLLRHGRAELARYGVELRTAKATDAAHGDGRFVVSLDNDERCESRMLLLATGVVDCLPQIEGAEECYGTSLFHCPYCDGWEVRDQPLGVYARGSRGVGLSLALQMWSRDVVLCTDGPARLRTAEADRLRARGIDVREETIARFAHADGQIERVVFRGGESIARSAIFFNTTQYTRSPLAERLGCQFTSRGAVRANQLGATRVRGLYVAGDASRDVQVAVVAAAEGAKVGYAINVELQKMDM